MLSKFFRGNLERRNVSCQLREELEYSQNYLELYKDIYPDRLNIEWNVDERFLDVGIPTYILQPIVENSLVHGMEPMIGTCTIRIRVREQGGCLVISVWDDGGGIAPEKLKQLMDGMGESRHIGIRECAGPHPDVLWKRIWAFHPVGTPRIYGSQAYAAAEVRIMTGFCRQHILRQEREG